MALFAVQWLKGGDGYPYPSVVLNSWVTKDNIYDAYTWAQSWANSVFTGLNVETPFKITITEDKPTP